MTNSEINVTILSSGNLLQEICVINPFILYLLHFYLFQNGYVISYLEVTVTVDELGEIDFILLEGQAGSKYMIFQMISNHSEFLSYSYMTYGIKDDEYKKVAAATLTNAHTPC